MLKKQEFEELYSQNEDRLVNTWKEFLRFASISAQPEFDDECRRCVSWLIARVENMGFRAEIVETSGKPLLLAYRAGTGKRLVCYGHYDVQPPEPLELWETPPFEPTLRNGRLYARGAQDNKGQLSFILAALEILIEQNQLTVPVTLVIEGEEEVGSGGLATVLPEISSRIQGDILLLSDTATLDPSVCTITLGLRGIVSLGVELEGPSKDLHSGIHGGAAPNVAQIAAEIAASFHNPEGEIAVDGFYDEILPVDEATRKLVNALPVTAEQYEAMTGVAPVGGEKGKYTFLERFGIRPTVEINGIHSGYGGPGSKTIIPAKASIRISSRLVVGQNPQTVLAKLEKHIRDRVPAGVRVDIPHREEGGIAFRLDPYSAEVALAKDVIEQEMGMPSLFMWLGASVPVIPALQEASGAKALMVGFGLEADSIHAPNESFALEQFRNGFLFTALFVQRLGQA